MSEWFPVYVGLRHRGARGEWVPGKGKELPSLNGGRFEINQLSFADDTAQVADSEKFC